MDQHELDSLRDINVTVVEVDMTDQDIRNIILMYNRTHVPVWITVFGYDNDPREIWQVPEVRALFMRLINMGVLGVMNWNIPGMEDYVEHAPGLGALQVWAMGTGQMNHAGHADLDLKQFSDLLDESLKKCVALCAGELSEGQHRGAFENGKK